MRCATVVGLRALIGADVFLAPSVFASETVTYFVDSSATGNLNGQTWATAFDDLQDALSAAASCKARRSRFHSVETSTPFP